MCDLSIWCYFWVGGAITFCFSCIRSSGIPLRCHFPFFFSLTSGSAKRQLRLCEIGAHAFSKPTAVGTLECCLPTLGLALAKAGNDLATERPLIQRRCLFKPFRSFSQNQNVRQASLQRTSDFRAPKRCEASSKGIKALTSLTIILLKFLLKIQSSEGCETNLVLNYTTCSWMHLYDGGWELDVARSLLDWWNGRLWPADTHGAPHLAWGRDVCQLVEWAKHHVAVSWLQQPGLRLVSEARGDRFFARSSLAPNISCGFHHTSTSRKLLLAKRGWKQWISRCKRFDWQSASRTTSAESRERCFQLFASSGSIFRWESFKNRSVRFLSSLSDIF